MPGTKRKGSYLKRPYVKRRYAARRSSRLRARPSRALAVSRLGTTMVHRYCKWANPSNVNVDAGGTVYAGVTSGIFRTSNSAGGQTEMDIGLGFTFGDLTQSTTYETLYDQYKLTTIVVYVELLNNPSATYGIESVAQNTSTNFYPRLWYIRDHDDNAVLSLANMKNYAHARERVLQPNKKIKIVLSRPSILDQVQGTLNYKVDYKPGWLDMADPNIVHYGIKMCVDLANQAASATVPWQIRIESKYYFSCKTPR